MAILVHKHLPLCDVQTFLDKSGRCLLLKGLIYGEAISMVNVYMPPVQSSDFIMFIFSKFEEWQGNGSVVTGDFNCVL